MAGAESEANAMKCAPAASFLCMVLRLFILDSAFNRVSIRNTHARLSIVSLILRHKSCKKYTRHL